MPKAVLIPESCKGCALCVRHCPQDCFTMGKQLNSKGYLLPVFEGLDSCTGCTACARLCPDSALMVYASASDVGGRTPRRKKSV